MDLDDFVEADELVDHYISQLERRYPQGMPDYYQMGRVIPSELYKILMAYKAYQGMVQ